MTRDKAAPTILFGAFDRHNFGDLLFPHVSATLLNSSNLLFAGLADRDLSAYGGHKVRSLVGLAAEWGSHPVNIIHAGGEVLTCNTWQAAAMILPPDDAKDIIVRYDRYPQAALEWGQRQFGIPALAPYTVPRRLFPNANKIIYNAVGGIDLGDCDASFRTEVLAKLKAADAVSVRDKYTHDQLLVEGIHSRLLPDPAVMVAELFGNVISERMSRGELVQVRQAFPQGYLAVQFSADFEAAPRTAPLLRIAAQLDELARASRLGVVFFRAGAAPWHDELDCYATVVEHMRSTSSFVFRSLDIWDICALIAGSHGYLGSSLHGRIVAMAFAVPRLNLRHPAHIGRATKHIAYATTWEDEGAPAMVDLDDMAEGMQRALRADPRTLRHTAERLVQDYQNGFKELCAGLA